MFRRWSDELKELPKFLIVFTVAVVELLIENYCVWYDDIAFVKAPHLAVSNVVNQQDYFSALRRVVAAGNTRKYDKDFVPLQDNVAVVTRGLMQQSLVIKWLVTWHWAHIANFLVAFLCVPFSCAWDQVGVVIESAVSTGAVA